MAKNLCKEQQISFGNSKKYSDLVNIFCKISAYKDPTVERKSRKVKKLLIFFTEISCIGFN